MQEKILEYLVGFLTFGISQKRLKDRKVFDRLAAELSPDSSAIILLKEHDMGGPVKLDNMTPLYRANDTWLDIHNEFQTKGIETRKVEFISKLREFLELFSQRSGGSGNGFISIGMRDLEDRPEMLDYRDRLNKSGTEAYEKYIEFYRYAHKKLPV